MTFKNPRLNEYAERYQRLHNQEDAFLSKEGKLHRTSRIFDGSNFYEKLWDAFYGEAMKRQSFTIIDYGCGKAEQLFKRHKDDKSFHEIFEGKVQCYYAYDPGNLQYARRPARGQKFDFLICADVMEHVPEEGVDEVLADCASMLEPDGKVFFSIAGKEAYKSFADGENLHCTIRSLEWWVRKLHHYFGDRFYLSYTTDKHYIVSPWKHQRNANL